MMMMLVTRKGVFVYEWCWTWCGVSRPDRILDNDADPDYNYNYMIIYIYKYYNYIIIIMMMVVMRKGVSGLCI